MNNLVFTEQSLLAFIENITEEKLNKDTLVDSKNYITLVYDNFQIFLTGNKKDSDIESIPFIIFDKSISIKEMRIEDLQSLFFTVHRIILLILQHKGTDFSSSSLIYKKSNYLVLKVFDKKHLFIEKNAGNTVNFFIFKLTNQKENIEDSVHNSSICNILDSLRENIKRKFIIELDKKELAQIDFTYDLNTFYNDKEQSTYTYDQWISHLSPRQLAFFNNAQNKSLKLTGPAGTGKTLVMELKTIKIAKQHPDARILFTCHSWAVACQVSDFIDMVAPELSNKIIIYPLLELAKSNISNTNGREILGDDSFEGKYEQIMILSDIIQNFLQTDWIIYKNKCSPEFISSLENVSLSNNNFTWDLMTEFSCVIGANGIMPGKVSREKYKNLKRYNWMMNFSNKTELDVSFSIYEQYMKYLFDNGNITSDQVTNDYINYLSTYNWYYSRNKEGFDYIFVDEMQLFNDQERLALTYLSRNTDDYPVIIMSLDPKQSVYEVYTDLGINKILNSSNPETEASIGDSTNYSLDIAYRYTKEILNFLKHVDSSYPQMDLGHEWNNKISSLKANKVKSGIIPCLYTFKNESIEIQEAIKLAEQFNNEGKQTIILSLQESLFELLQKQTNDKNKFKKILSRKDVEFLKYIKRKIIISEPSYVIGLQFDTVILVGCYSIFNKYSNNSSYYKRRFLSDLYLGSSRAKERLILTNNQNMEDFPDFLQQAIDKNLIKKINN